MPEYRRPSLLTANQTEVSQHLLGKGIQSRITKDETAMLITIAGTSDDLNAAMADFANVGDAWRYPLPPAIATHAQHLIDFKNAVRGGTQSGKTTAVRLGEMEHVAADLVDAIRLYLDDRLG